MLEEYTVEDHEQHVQTLLANGVPATEAEQAQAQAELLEAFRDAAVANGDRAARLAVRMGHWPDYQSLAFFDARGWIKFDDETSYLDEVLGWSLAALGFYFQWSMSFDVPFPLNLLTWPLELAEWYVRAQITYG